MRKCGSCVGIGFLCLVMMGLVCPQGGDTPGAAPLQQDPVPGVNVGTPGTAQKLSELLLGGIPGSVTMDLARDLGYVGVDKRIRRIDLETRLWRPLSSPNGVFYGLDSRDDFLAQIDPGTGQIVRISSYPESAIIPPLNAGFVTGMDYNPDTGRLYVIDVFAAGRVATLFEFDPATGERMQIGESGLNGGLASVFCLARDPATGLLYTADVYDRLWRIDPNSETATQVSGVNIGFANVQGLSFSPLDGKLYGLNPPGNGPVQVVTIDVASGIGSLVSQLPLGFTGGSLAFRNDGTLWTVNLLGVLDTVMYTDSLIQIDYATNPATIPTNFPTLELSVMFGPQSLFQAINSLCFAPQGPADQTVPSVLNIDAVAVDNHGGVMASTGDTVYGFNPDFRYSPSGMDAGGSERFREIAVHPANDIAYVWDGHSGFVYEFQPGMIGVTRRIQYRPASNFFSAPQHPASGLDPVTNRLFVVGDFQLHRIDLTAGTSEEIDNGVNDDPVAVIVDSDRRRLHVNMRLGGPDGCSSIRTYDLDTMQVLGEVCVGIQVFNMAFDPVRNRIAANARFTVPSFDTMIHVIDMDDSTEASVEPFVLRTAADNTNASDALLAFDSNRNQLLVARPDTPARIEFYALPE